MKLTNTQTMKRKSGMTLLELTVVILVLLSLISILFIGARAWKKGSDRAGCILNIRNVQQAVRSYGNMYNATTVPAGELLGTGKFVESQPICPGGGTYSPADLSVAVTVPAVSTLAMTCGLATTENHVPSSIAGW
jgi:prepilin-type N-terminal cleavage/methylation domain-containing protein